MAKRPYRIDENTFLLELLMAGGDRQECYLMQALFQDHNSAVNIGAYADYLEERGRVQSAEMVRKGFVPGARVIDSQLSQTPVVSGNLPPGFLDLPTLPPGRSAGRISSRVRCLPRSASRTN